MDRSWCRVPTKASVLKFSAFFIVQISHPYMTTGKTIALTRRTFVGKMMQSRGVINIGAVSTGA